MKTNRKRQSRKKTNGKDQEGIRTLKQEGIRMDGALKKRINAYREKENERGMEASFSMAVRALLKQALDAAKIP